MQISVNNPILFHDFVVAPAAPEFLLPSLLLCFCAESSALFLGIRKGARDFDMADSSAEETVDKYRRKFSNRLSIFVIIVLSYFVGVDDLEEIPTIDLAEREADE